MKKLIPYILAYLIIVSGTAAFSFLLGHGRISPVPPNSVTVMSALPQGDLAAKLDQAGFHEQMTIKPAPALSIAIYFLYPGIICAAFAGLAAWLQRAFRAGHPNRVNAA